MTSQIERLRAAYRYSSGKARGEIKEQIADIVGGVRAAAGCAVGQSSAAASGGTSAAASRWCAWCGDTLSPQALDDYCSAECRVADCLDAENRFQAPLASEPPAPSVPTPTPEPPHAAPALVEPTGEFRGGNLTGHLWWAAEGRLDRLHQLWEVDGWSASEIARDMGCTKNAVIGQVQRRLDLHQRRESTIKTTVVQRHALFDMKPGCCAWPQRAGDRTPLEDAPHPGAPDFTFCGEPAQGGSPYCAPHSKRAWAKPRQGTGWDDARRDKARALLLKRGAGDVQWSLKK